MSSQWCTAENLCNLLLAHWNWSVYVLGNQRVLVTGTRALKEADPDPRTFVGADEPDSWISLLTWPTSTVDSWTALNAQGLSHCLATALKYRGERHSLVVFGTGLNLFAINDVVQGGNSEIPALNYVTWISSRCKHGRYESLNWTKELQFSSNVIWQPSLNCTLSHFFQSCSAQPLLPCSPATTILTEKLLKM